jgi:hypothetical protein
LHLLSPLVNPPRNIGTLLHTLLAFEFSFHPRYGYTPGTRQVAAA